MLHNQHVIAYFINLFVTEYASAIQSEFNMHVVDYRFYNYLVECFTVDFINGDGIGQPTGFLKCK